MTYSIANHRNSNLSREQVRWEVSTGTIIKIAAWAVPNRVYVLTNLPTHLDMYLCPCGAYVSTLDEAIELSNTDPADYDNYATATAGDFDDYTDLIEDEAINTDILNQVILQKMDVIVSELISDGETVDTFQVIQRGSHFNNAYKVAEGWEFKGMISNTPESVVTAWLSMNSPIRYLKALTAAQQEILERNIIPDYN